MLTAEGALETMRHTAATLRNIRFTEVLDITENDDGEGHPAGSPLRNIDIQDVSGEALLELLNSEELMTGKIPESHEILSFVSETTGKNIQRLYRNLRERRIAILQGPTGTAKTTMAKTLAAHLGIALYQESGAANKTFPEFTQRVVIRKHKGKKEVVRLPAGLIKALLNGGLYLVDEFNNLEGDVQLAIAQIVDDNEILLDSGVRVPVSPQFFLALTANPDYGGTKPINDAVLRRAGGPIEIGYLPEDEEVETVFRIYENEILEIAAWRQMDLKPAIPREEAEKVVKTFREAREKIRELPMELALNEDRVHAADNFSVRKMIDFLVLAQMGDVRMTGVMLENTIGTLPGRVQREIRAIFTRCETLGFNEQSETRKEMDIDRITAWMDMHTLQEHRRGKTDEAEADASMIAALREKGTPEARAKERVTAARAMLDENPGDPFLSAPGLFKSKNPGKRKRFRLTELASLQGAETIYLHVTDARQASFQALSDGKESAALPAFDFKAGEAARKVPEGKTLVHDESIRKTGEAIARAMMMNGEVPVITRMKKCAAFEAGGKRGFARIGFRAHVGQAAYRPEDGEEKAFILNRHRLASVTEIFVETTAKEATHFIDPKTGVLSEAKAKGLVPVRQIAENEAEKADEDTETLAANVRRKIRLCLSHADEGAGESEDENADAEIRTVEGRIEPAFEGRDVSEKATPETVGRHLAYLTRTMEGHLLAIRRANLAMKNVLLRGVSGTGKTSLAKTYAIQSGLPYVAVQFHEQSTEQSTLKHIVVVEGRAMEVPYPLLLAYEFGWVAELRELNAADADEIAFLNVLLDKNGQIECDGRVIKRHRNFIPIASLNPHEEIFEGTRPMNTALLNRFAVQLNIEYPTEHEEMSLLMAVLTKENPELLDREGEAAMKDVMTAFVKTAAFIRQKMEEFKSNATVRGRLQKIKMATDFLMDIARNARDLNDLLEQFHQRLELAPDDRDVIERMGLQTQITAIVADLSRYA